MFEDVDYWAENKIKTVRKDTDNSGVEETEDKMLRLFKQKTMIVLDQIKHLGLPKNEEQIRIISKRTFNAIAFLSHICENEIIEDLKLVIYSFNHEAAKVFMELMNSGRIKRAEILMSNLRNKAHREKEKLTKEMLINHPNINLWFCSSHAKIMCMKTEKGNYYNLEGSGNLSYNSRVEQYILDNDVKLYEFICNWFEELKKHLKGKKELIEY